jgi:hypothetical protein
MPFFEADAVLMDGDGVQDLDQPQDAASWKLDGPEDRIENPAENQLARLPTGVSFEKLLEGGWFITIGTVYGGINSPKDFIQGVQEHMPVIDPLAGSALGAAYEIIYEDFIFC